MFQRNGEGGRKGANNDDGTTNERAVSGVHEKGGQEIAAANFI
jgi:hypothetical protein